MEQKIRVETTTLSSKGQVVLPQDVRERLKLKDGDKFLVIAEADTVILKAIKPIPRAKFAAMLKITKAAAKRTGITPKDLEAAISKVRHTRSA